PTRSVHTGFRIGPVVSMCGAPGTLVGNGFGSEGRAGRVRSAETVVVLVALATVVAAFAQHPAGAGAAHELARAACRAGLALSELKILTWDPSPLDGSAHGPHQTTLVV